MKTRERMAESCAWRMVSKLNVRPFQSVNSPLVEPVRTLRPSGVHYHSYQHGRRYEDKDREHTATQFTGHRILLVDV